MILILISLKIDEVFKKIKGDGLSEKDVNDLIKNHSSAKQATMYAKDKEDLTAAITSDVMRNIADKLIMNEPEIEDRTPPSPRTFAPPPASDHVP